MFAGADFTGYAMSHNTDYVKFDMAMFLVICFYNVLIEKRLIGLGGAVVNKLLS